MRLRRPHQEVYEQAAKYTLMCDLLALYEMSYSDTMGTDAEGTLVCLLNVRDYGHPAGPHGDAVPAGLNKDQTVVTTDEFLAEGGDHLRAEFKLPPGMARRTFYWVLKIKDNSDSPFTTPRVEEIP